MTPYVQEREPEGQYSLEVHDWLNWRYWAHVSSSLHTIWKGFIVEWRSPCCSVSSPCTTSSTCTAKQQNIFLILSCLWPYDFTLSCLSHSDARFVCSIYKQNAEKSTTLSSNLNRMPLCTDIILLSKRKYWRKNTEFHFISKAILEDSANMVTSKGGDELKPYTL